MPWVTESGLETADLADDTIVDPIAFCVDRRTGTVVIVQCSESIKAMQVDRQGNLVTKEISGVAEIDGFRDFNACSSLTDSGYILLLCDKKVVVVDLATGSARETPGKGYRLCSCSCEGHIFLADERGFIYTAEGSLKQIYANPSLLDNLDPAVGPVAGERMPWSRCDNQIPREDRQEMSMRVNPSASVLNAFAASQGASIWYCAGHGLTCITEVTKKDCKTVDKFPNQRSADGLSYPTVLFWVGDTLFAQCMDGVRKVPASLRTGDKASIAVRAQDMLDEGDNGSPEPYPSDFIGVDDKYLYVLIERDFYQGKALRRFAHGLESSKQSSARKLEDPKLMPAPDGSVEMKVSTKKPPNFYVRAARSFLKGVEARPAEPERDGKKARDAQDAKPPVDDLRISGLGEAINVAASAAVQAEADGCCTITRIQTAYPSMEGSGHGCGQILIDVKRK